MCVGFWCQLCFVLMVFTHFHFLFIAKFAFECVPTIDKTGSFEVSMISLFALLVLSSSFMLYPLQIGLF